jgi:outer membrane protein TolC
MKAASFSPIYCAGLYIISALLNSSLCYPQTFPDAQGTVFTLPQCIEYALKNQPFVKQSKLDESITRKNILISLSGWFPQLNLDADLRHNFQLPTSFFPNLNDPAGPQTEVTTGLINTSTADFSANQAIYSTDLVFAGKTVKNLRLRALQNTENSEINSVAEVSKSFYDVMLTIEQLGLWNEEIQRLERNQEDAFHLYKSGLTDKIDYQQALIAVNNAKAQKRITEEAIKGKYAILKQSMGFPAAQPLSVLYDTTSFEKEILTDTLKVFSYNNRIEYRMLQTDMQLQNAQTGYYRWSFLPLISAFYDYNLNYFNDSFSPLFNTSYPNSLIGIKLNLPLFRGTSRWQNLQKSRLQYQRLQIGQDYLASQFNTQYTQALGNYKGNLNALRIAKENISIAQEVFNTVAMQYNQGIKTYLNLIVAETDLRSAKLNYISSLFQVLSSKLDLKVAIGTITVN